MGRKSHIGLFAAVLSMFVFAAVACGGDDGGDDKGRAVLGKKTMDAGMTDGGTTADGGMTDGGTTADGGMTDGGMTDGGTTADGGTTDGGGTGGGGTMKEGNVSILQNRRTDADGRETVSYSALAGFSETESNDTCETTEEGTCSVTVCDNDGGDDDEGPYRSAGEITISGGAQEITMSPSDQNNYYSEQGMGEFWNNSHTLIVEAAGDVVPMFTGELDPAANTTLDSPDVSTDTWTVDTTSDITVEWDTADIDSGVFGVTLSKEGDTQTSTLECEWDATSGSGTIPSSLLGEMITGTGGGYTIGVGDNEGVSVGDWLVELGVIEIVDSGQATFE